MALTTTSRSQSPFRGLPEPQARTFLDRLFRRAYPDRAKAAIERMLAQEGPFGVSESRITGELLRFGVTGDSARELLRELWSQALQGYLSDDALTDEEIRSLERLCRLCDVSFDEVQVIQEQLIHPRFKKAIADVIADQQVSDEERTALREMAIRLRLPPTLAQQMLVEASGKEVQRVFDALMADRRFSPEEYGELERVAKNLGVQVTMTEETKTHLRRFATMWRAEAGDLPEEPVGISLQRGEVCHFHCEATWNELRTRTIRVNYHGPTGSIRIAKGIRYRLGSIAPSRITQEELTLLGTGDFYITNKRVIFNGEKRNMAIRLSALIAVQVYSDGLVLEKASGRSPHLILSGDSEMASVLLTSAMAATSG